MNKSGFNEHIGYELVKLNEKFCELKLNVEDYHRNTYGYVHGGVYFTLSDIACGLFVRQDERNWVTLNGNINYLKAAKNETLTVITKLISKTRKLAVIEVVIKHDTKIFTQGTFTMYVID